MSVQKSDASYNPAGNRGPRVSEQCHIGNYPRWVVALHATNYDSWVTPKRIHILGGSNAGKTTIAKALASRLDIPAIGLDDLHWDNSGGYLGIRRDADEKQRMLSEILQREAWILEGVYYRWLAQAFEQADLIVMLTIPTWKRQARMLRRFARGKLSSGAVQDGNLRGLWESFRWNRRYDRSYLPATRDFLCNLGKKWTECQTFEDVVRAVEAPNT